MTSASASPRGSNPFESTLLRPLRERWWLFLLRGLAGIVFGVLAFVWPILTLLSLAILWGAYALADGIFALWAGLAGRGGAAQRWWLALVGAAGILAGVLTFSWPGLTAQFFIFVIAGWAIVIGVLQIIGAIGVRKEIEGEWMLILSGIVSVLLGIAILAWPLAGALAMVWTIGAFSIVAGCCYLALAFRLRGLGPA